MSLPSSQHSRSVSLASIDDLDDAIQRLACHANAVTYRMLLLVREFDDRFGWAKWSYSSCAEWLHWRIGIGRSAAQSGAVPAGSELGRDGWHAQQADALVAMARAYLSRGGGAGEVEGEGEHTSEGGERRVQLSVPIRPCSRISNIPPRKRGWPR